MAQHNETGTFGERLAVAYFEGIGFTILHTNWRYTRFEVDIIASKKNILHFIEIKTRRSLQFGNPEDSVSKKKMQNLISASEAYLYQNPVWQRIQFDVLAITILKKEPPVYFYIEDIYV